MPTAGQWTKFLVSAGGFLGMGIYTVNYLMPSDEEIIAQLSPELKARYYKEREIRHRADQIMQQRIKESKGTPAWLQGSKTMQDFSREIMLQARDEVEAEARDEAELEQREVLRLLAKEESKR